MRKSKIEKRLPEPQHNKEQKNDVTSVSPAIAKPNVICCQSPPIVIKNSFTDKDDYWIEYIPKSQLAEVLERL